MAWFIKTETFRVSPEQARPHLAAHRAWVAELRSQGIEVSSGYLVDGQGQPGGGGLLLLQAEDHAAAEALVRQDPMVRSGCVDWRLQGWVPAVGDLATDASDVGVAGAGTRTSGSPPGR
ncbi:MAG: YciI family protein [Prochlorococcaceae cyanobacterium]